MYLLLLLCSLIIGGVSADPDCSVHADWPIIDFSNKPWLPLCYHDALPLLQGQKGSITGVKCSRDYQPNYPQMDYFCVQTKLDGVKCDIVTGLCYGACGAGCFSDCCLALTYTSEDQVAETKTFLK